MQARNFRTNLARGVVMSITALVLALTATVAGYTLGEHNFASGNEVDPRSVVQNLEAPDSIHATFEMQFLEASAAAEESNSIHATFEMQFLEASAAAEGPNSIHATFEMQFLEASAAAEESNSIHATFEMQFLEMSR